MAFNPNQCLKLQNVSYKDNTFTMQIYGYAKCPDYKYYFSKDGVTWEESVTVAPGGTVYVKGTNYPGWAWNEAKRHTRGAGWVITGTEMFDVISGTAFSLVNDGAGGVPFPAIVPNYGFSCLFRGTKLRKVRSEIFPIGTASVGMLCETFANCSELISVPEGLLKDTNWLVAFCFYEMFSNCPKLVQAPVLPVSELFEVDAYGFMFYGCSSLKKVVANTPRLYPITDAGTFTREWLDPSANGTFYGPENIRGIDGTSTTVPSTWNIVSGGYYPPPDPPPPTPSGAYKSASFVYFGNITVGGTL